MPMPALPLATSPAGMRRARSAARTDQLLRARDRLPVGHAERGTLRGQAIEENLPIATRLARRYTGRGESFDDLVQVASLALIKAVDSFDSNRSVPFAGLRLRRRLPRTPAAAGPADHLSAQHSRHALHRRDDPGPHRHPARRLADAGLPAPPARPDPAPGRSRRGLGRTLTRAVIRHRAAASIRPIRRPAWNRAIP
jgi:hypothetical protein